MSVTGWDAASHPRRAHPAWRLADLGAMVVDRLKALQERTRHEPADVESRVFARWRDAGIFHPEPGEDGYSIAVPPPNVTGSLHMGHALNGAIQDACIRVARMRGKRAKWIYGTDHAGIATQVKVEEALAAEGRTKEELGREAFVERVWRWREQYGSTITEQYQRLGASLDYDDERFTMDERYARAVLHVFVRLFEKGLIYRDNYMVNWDPGTRSAISDLEVVPRQVEDTLYAVDYPLESGSGSVTVATVRPETMLADTAIAVNPADERYSRLVTEAAGERFAGLPVDEARVAVVEALREQGLISGTQPYVHDVPHSQRTGMRIEPLISLQWFCDMAELAKPAIDVVEEGRVRFHPQSPWTGVYLRWLREIRPWCISRQLWWGHQIPAWYRGEELYVGEQPPE